MVKGWLYRDDLRPVAELDGAGNVVSRFVWADGLGEEDVRGVVKSMLGLAGSSLGISGESLLLGPALVIESGTTYATVKDHLGTSRLTVNVATGAVELANSVDEWGRSPTPALPGTRSIAFASGLLDEDTALIRFGARDYDPTVGRWTSPDASSFIGSPTNLYAYAQLDPINYLDPTGYFIIDLIKRVSSAIACIYYELRLQDAIDDCQQEFEDKCSEDPICDECLELGGDMGSSRFRCLMEKDPGAFKGLIQSCSALAGQSTIKRK
jgi:RHS repeat-associated protein